MKKGLVVVLSLMVLSATGFADRLVGLNANGELWQGNSDDIAGTKTLLATLTGSGYIDSAFDGQYIYGLRDDGEVYRSDLSGNVTNVSLTGWDSDMLTINARSGTLYGMKNVTGDADVLAADGTVALHIGGSSTFSDMTITDDGRIWVLLTSGANKAYVYGFTNSYSGALNGFDKYLNFSGSQEGMALVSDGTELYCASDNVDTNGNQISAYVKHTTGGADAVAWSGTYAPVFADMDAGSVLFAITTNGVVQSMALTGSARTFWGDLSGADTVSLQVIPEPVVLGLIGFSGISLLVLNRFLTV